MNEPKKKAESKRKLTLNRETLRTLEINEPRLLDGVVGGGGYVPTRPTFASEVNCETETAC